MATVERINALLVELDSLRGFIPGSFARMLRLAGSGIRLDKSMYLAPSRAPCSALVKGRPCHNSCKPGCEMCGIHLKALERREKPVKARCGALTAKGTPCRCKAYKMFGMCKRHAVKEGLISEPPTECAICYDAMDSKNRKETSCGHFFHTACLVTYAEIRGGAYDTPRGKRHLTGPCPMCRTPFKMVTHA